jgi:large subunit ribosomal protein L10
VTKYSEANEKCLQLLAARFEGHMISQEEVEALSRIPSKDQLRAQFLGLLEAPMSQTLGVIDALLSSLVCCVDNKVKKDQSQ